MSDWAMHDGTFDLQWGWHRWSR